MTDEATIKEGDIITIDGWGQAPFKTQKHQPKRKDIKPLQMKMVDGVLRMMLEEGYAPVMDSTTGNGVWMFTDNGFVLGRAVFTKGVSPWTRTR